MNFDVDAVIKENWKSDETIGEILCVVPEFYVGVPIEKIGFNVAVNSALLRHGNGFTVKTLSELLIVTISDLYSIRNLGVGGIKVILSKTSEFLEKHKPEELIGGDENSQSVQLDIDRNGNDIFYEQAVLGENVRNIRKSKKQSQAEFAENCGVTISVLRSIENNISNPKLSALSSIARYADCTVSQLLEKAE